MRENLLKLLNERDDLPPLPELVLRLDEELRNQKSEINKILGKMEEAKEAPPPDEIPFRRGELVEVTDGPFTGFNGTVEDIFPDKGKVKVTVSLFGRPTPIMLDYVQLKAL